MPGRSRCWRWRSTRGSRPSPHSTSCSRSTRGRRPRIIDRPRKRRVPGNPGSPLGIPQETAIIMKPYLELGLDTFGDVTLGADGRALPQAQVIRNVIDEAVLADELG